ncbi:uroporphyrinogen-III synthase [Myroides sp. DW712]|uniref:uroporphyrinogen-III synthase n=1 Tax=Myroides sp. DW712 TaxID=3389800 RepID=UPI00397A56CD
MPAVLSTRKVSQLHHLQINESAIDWVEEDFIGIQPCVFSVDQPREILLFTSQNAVRSVLNNPASAVLKGVPAICVGIKTKELLAKNGWTVLAWTHYAKELTNVIQQQFASQSFSFFCGNIRREVLPTFFKQHQIPFDEYVVYQTVKYPHQMQQKLDGICFYSPSAIESFLENNAITTEVCFCIGDTTADALKGITTQIVVASQPTIEATLAACFAYYK